MAWRPSTYLIEGELDNTVLGRVTGWLRFAGLPDRVHLDLTGDCHRDIRGAKLRIRGPATEATAAAADTLDGIARRQVGEVGDITAGREPRDYVNYPYIEWYSAHNGRVVIELEPDDVEILSRPIPACESDPIPRATQQHKLADFMHQLSTQLGVPALAIGGDRTIVSDPDFTHWVVVQEQIIGEARDVESETGRVSFAFVRLFGAPECAEFGSIESRYLRPKAAPQHP